MEKIKSTLMYLLVSLTAIAIAVLQIYHGVY
jgi:hypothetical protein